MWSVAAGADAGGICTCIGTCAGGSRDDDAKSAISEANSTPSWTLPVLSKGCLYDGVPCARILPCIIFLARLATSDAHMSLDCASFHIGFLSNSFASSESCVALSFLNIGIDGMLC